MSKETLQQTVSIIPFTKELATQYASEICTALDQIPEVEQHTLDKLLVEAKGDRILHKKWDHSFILLDGGQFVGIIVGYERDLETATDDAGNLQYPHNSIYLNDLAIAAEYQRRGLGKFLVETWLEKNMQIGFLELDGKLRFSVQTNGADWNAHVQQLYESFGFKKIAEKKYENRTDMVYLLEVADAHR